jgi:DNA-binding beta-propeller fold protein YncE
MRLYKMFAGLAGAALACAAATGLAATPAYHVVDRIAGPDGGWDYVRVNARTGQVLVTRGGAVMAVDIAGGKVNPSLAKGARLHIAMPVAGGTELLLTNGGSDTAVFADARTGAAIATVATGKGPDSAAFDARSGLVLVIDHAGGDVTLVDAKAHRRVGSIEVGGELEEAAVDGAGRAFVNVEDRNEIAVLDLAARKVTARYRLPGCDGPTGLAYDARDGLLIAACDGTTVLVDARSGRLADTLATGKGADGVAYDPARRLAFIPAGRDGTLSVIALSGGHGHIVQRLQTHKGARTIGIDERTGRLYLPSADYLPAVGDARPQTKPGSFRLLVVAP